MPEIPHEYTVHTVRSEENEAAYLALFNAIAVDGTFERWRGRRKRYLYPGDGWKYWAMTSSIWYSRILNRMRIEDDLDRLRAEGQLEAVAHAERHLRRARLTARKFLPCIKHRRSAKNPAEALCPCCTSAGTLLGQ